MNNICLLTRVGEFSLYADSLDKPTHVCVKLESNDHQASHASASLQIPTTLWEDIRQKSALLYDLADISEVDLRKRALERAARWEELQRLLKPHVAPYKALLALKRAYRLPTSFGEHFRELRIQRKAQQKLRKALELWRSKATDKTKIRPTKASQTRIATRGS